VRARRDLDHAGKVNLFPSGNVFKGVESGITDRHIVNKRGADAGKTPRRANGRLGRRTPVIADSGNRAEVVVLSAAFPVSYGTRFRYRGTTWVVIGRRHDSGILVAEPTEH